MNAKMLISSLLKSKASMRWYKTFRIDSIESDDDIFTVYRWTRSIARGRPLLPKVIDVDDLSKHTR